jgi:hypothetical protein
MAGRTPAIGLSYFPMDINFFSDIKVRKLIKYQGAKAITVYVHLLCTIYKDGYYTMWDNELPFMISEVTGYEEAYIREVIKCLVNINLFSKPMFENGIITSKGIQERYKKICLESKRKFNVSEYSLIDSELMPIDSELMPIDSELMQQRKVKESKGKEVKENARVKTPPPPPFKNPVSTSNNLILSYEDTKREFISSKPWQEQICMKHKIEIDFVVSDMMKFLDKLNSQNQFPRKLSDTKAHYYSRLEKFLKAKNEVKAKPVYDSGIYEDCPTLD